MSSLINNFQNVTIRCCSYCGEQGHNIRRCRDAYIDGSSLHIQIMYIVQQYLAVTDLLITNVKLFIYSLTFSKLKLLSYIHTDIRIFASQLYINFSIPLSYRDLTTKGGLAIVLGLYYQKIIENYFNMVYVPSNSKKYNIKINLNNIVEQCPAECTLQCPICLDSFDCKIILKLNCNHGVCSSCFDKYLSSLNNNINPCCCLCREKISSIDFSNEECFNDIKNKYIENVQL